MRIAPLALLLLFLTGVALAACAHGGGEGADPGTRPGEAPAFPFITHVDQAEITAGKVSFEQLFSFGDALFGAFFNGLDGSGALVLPDGTALPSRYSRIPPGGGRFTGPNGNACVSCHNVPLEDGAGEASSNVLQDPSGLGLSGLERRGGFNTRNAVALFGAGAIQRLAEEMTDELGAAREEAAVEALAGPVGTVVSRDLIAKGVAFGRISAIQSAAGTVSFDVSLVVGVDQDLVVRPFGWKGNITTLRDFVRGAANDELGMQPVELVAMDPKAEQSPEHADLDGDGVVAELSVGDITALTMYLSAQPIPATSSFLASQHLSPPPTTEVATLQQIGQALFGSVGCAGCHVPELGLGDVEFREPSQRGRGAYLDSSLARFSVLPTSPARASLVQQGDGLRLVPDAHGGALVSLFGDLKRHNMGKHLTDSQLTLVNGADGRHLVQEGGPVSVPTGVFLTPELWGVGSTGPWLHDGRAGTLEEAILLHGIDPLVQAVPPVGDPDRSEAQEARDAFAALSPEDRTAVVEFLKGLVLFKLAPPGGEQS